MHITPDKLKEEYAALVDEFGDTEFDQEYDEGYDDYEQEDEYQDEGMFIFARLYVNQFQTD